jgi:hypothetical protein
MRAIRFLVFLVVSLFSANALAADFNVSVGSSGGFVWVVNGQNNPTLQLNRGQTYTFAVNSPNHPFDIKTAPVTGTGSQYTNGVTGQEVMAGTLTFTVPSNAPNLLYYQCEVHGTMSGQLQIVPAIAPAAPAIPWTLVTLLAVALGTAIALRGRIARARA